ncbi:ArsR/SmtB family transcription factor [Arthrobacter rhizosphaerae]|uniref:ArsR/SmtB family transcription factor n=1 Tax=Arthrobacter rhizosphaerae TaxID=2855490 RepID=UPI003555BEB3
MSVSFAWNSTAVWSHSHPAPTTVRCHGSSGFPGTQGERSVESLTAAAGLGLSTASAHLQALKQAGLVTTRRDGSRIYYDLAGPDVAAFTAWCAALPVPGSPTSNRNAPNTSASRATKRWTLRGNLRK